MADITSKQYKVYLTPRISENIYGDEIQISAEILFNGIKTMKKSIDSGDHGVGVYTYGDVNLKMINENGKYNDEFDGRSIFKYSRDLAKIRIDYSDNDGDITRFKGIINDEATKQDFDKEEIEFRVLSSDSVIRTTQVSGGLIANGILASDAIKSILNQTKILRVLNFDSSNINVDQDFTVDIGSEFDNKNARKALNELLVASNSVLIIDSNDNMIVKSREQAPFNNILNLFGPFDERMRQNINSVKKYNSGIHRTFTSVKIGGVEVNDSAFILDFGYRQLEKTLSFITDEVTKTLVGKKILNEFKRPFVELEISVPTHVVRDSELLDTVSVNYPLRIRRVEDKFLPIIGITKVGESEMPLPRAFGDKAIPSAMGFKIIEIAENPKTFETILKLRQFGWFTDPTSSIVGFAVIGETVIGGTGDECDKWNPATIGGGQVGCTKIA